MAREPRELSSIVLAAVVVVGLGGGIALAGLIGGDGGAGAGAAAPCSPPCAAGEECIKGVCVGPPPPVADVPESLAVPSDSGVPWVPSVAISEPRMIKCGVSEEEKCFLGDLRWLMSTCQGATKEILGCYERVLRRDPEHKGSLKVVMEIDYPTASVRTTAARSPKITDRGLVECSREALAKTVNFTKEHAFQHYRLFFTIAFGMRRK